MFHADSRGPTIDRWDFDPATGMVGSRTTIATLTEKLGRPDGGACDTAGGYWSAGISAGTSTSTSASAGTSTGATASAVHDNSGRTGTSAAASSACQHRPHFAGRRSQHRPAAAAIASWYRQATDADRCC